MGISKSRMRKYYARYNREPLQGLYDVYKTCSQRKVSAWESICERMKSQGGTGLSVIGHGTSWSFTTGYTYTDEQGWEHFVVDTRDNVQDMLVSDLL